MPTGRDQAPTAPRSEIGAKALRAMLPLRGWLLLAALLASVAAEDGSCSSAFQCAPHVVVPLGTTRIPKFAFKDCKELTSIELPDSLEYIGSSAFSGARSLTYVSLPAGLQHIGTYAFSRTGLTSVTLPAALTSLEEYAFNECTDLLTADMAQAQLPTTPAGLFFGCTSLRDVTLPPALEHIRVATFYGCSALAAVDLPPTVSEIGEHAFRDCTSLKSIALPAAVRMLGHSAFDGCTALVPVEVPAGVRVGVSDDD